MTDGAPGEAQFDRTPETATRQVAASDWNRAEIEAQPEPSPPRERLFSRKVLIGWALFAIAAYFGVQIAVSALKISFEEAVNSGLVESATRTKDRIVIQTPNGTRISIGRERPGGPAVIVTPAGPGIPIPPVTPTGAAGPANAPAAPPAAPSELKKR